MRAADDNIVRRVGPKAVTRRQAAQHAGGLRATGLEGFQLALNHSVMAGLVPAIHVFLGCGTDVDARHKAGDDGAYGSSRAGTAVGDGLGNIVDPQRRT